jgi:hypothetical protein
MSIAYKELGMQIIGTDGMTIQELNHALQQGGKLVVFPYCISIIVLTFKRSSDIYFVNAGESPLRKSMAYTLISLLLGWWGFPWGPIYTIETLFINLRGGRDVTQMVLAEINRAA